MDLNAIRIFVKVARAGSFSLAAKRLQMPISTVSAKVAQLEQDLGVALLKRTTRQLHLTHLGAEFFKNASIALDEFQRAQDLVLSENLKMQGRVSVTAPVEMGMTTLTESIAGFIRNHPGVQVDLQLTDRVVDLVSENIDIAVRIGRLKDSSLVSKKIGETGLSLFASPEFIKQYTHPQIPHDIEGMPHLVFSLMNSDHWTLVNGERIVHIPLTKCFSTNNFVSLKRMTIEGLGIALLPQFLCAEEVQSGQLMHLMPDWSSQKGPVYLVFQKKEYLTRSTRALIDHLSSHDLTAF